MEDFKKLDAEGGRIGRSSHLQSISVLVLSLLLTASVATLIYMAVSPVQKVDSETVKAINSQPSKAPVDQSSKSVKDKAHLKFKTQDGDEMEEDVEYDEGREVAIYYSEDGSFLAEDFKKGLNIISVGEGGCYVIPVGTDKAASQKLKEFIKNYAGQEIQSKTETYTTDALPGAIEDTSFLPYEAEEKCEKIYWLSVVGKEAGKEDTGSELSRQKRGLCYTRCKWGFCLRICIG